LVYPLWVFGLTRTPRVSKKVVRAEIVRLLRLALDPEIPLEYADRYVELAREFSMKYRVRIPRQFRLFICRGCKRALRPGSTAIFRIRNFPVKHIYVKCVRCGKVYRKIFDSMKPD